MQKRWGAFLSSPYGVGALVILAVLAIVGHAQTIAQAASWGLPPHIWAAIFTALFIVVGFGMILALRAELSRERRDIERVRGAGRGLRRQLEQDLRDMTVARDAAVGERDRVRQDLEHAQLVITATRPPSQPVVFQLPPGVATLPQDVTTTAPVRARVDRAPREPSPQPASPPPKEPGLE
jgi:hypothetical protein